MNLIPTKLHRMDADSNDRNFDDDNDTLSNLYEYREGLLAGSADSDGDGVHDGAELESGADPFNADAYALESVPYSEDFEVVPLGDIDGIGQWVVSGDGTALVDGTNAKSGLQSLAVTKASGASSPTKLSSQFDGSDENYIWVDFWTIPQVYSSDTTVDLSLVASNASSAFFLKEGGVVRFLMETVPAAALGWTLLLIQVTRIGVESQFGRIT